MTKSKSRAVIVGNGNMEDVQSLKNYSHRFIVACDGGVRHCIRAGVKPDIIVGDLDSASKEDIAFFEKEGVVLIKLPEKKDLTDTEYAIELLAEEKCEELCLLALTGERLDHTRTNINLLYKCLKLGIKACIKDKYNTVTITDNIFVSNREKNETVSLIPLTEKVKSVTTKNLEYEITDFDMDIASSRGVSNVCLGGEMSVSVKEGVLLIFFSKDREGKAV
ncbi:MAG: thiamine diphosphokinase [Firmicutes bacterium]|nr:thiamine diphosphokinase [Bacillota bacterium]